MKLYLKPSYIFYLNFWKININVNTILFFNAYQNQFLFIKKKFNNIKYHKLIFNIKSLKIKYKKLFQINKLTLIKTNILYNFLSLYSYIIINSFIDLFYFLKSIQLFNQSLVFFLILSFKKNKLFINIKNKFKKNFLSISSGFFIKFYEKKKSFKKNKIIKLLMAKYIRKIFLISKIKNVILIIKKNPILLLELINFLNNPIAHKFINPFKNKVIEEDANNTIWIKFLYFIFIENKSFTKNKNYPKGRIKRKVLRKVIFENKIID